MYCYSCSICNRETKYHITLYWLAVASLVKKNIFKIKLKIQTYPFKKYLGTNTWNALNSLINAVNSKNIQYLEVIGPSFYNNV